MHALISRFTLTGAFQDKGFDTLMPDMVPARTRKPALTPTPAPVRWRLTRLDRYRNRS